MGNLSQRAQEFAVQCEIIGCGETAAVLRQFAKEFETLAADDHQVGNLGGSKNLGSLNPSS